MTKTRLDLGLPRGSIRRHPPTLSRGAAQSRGLIGLALSRLSFLSRDHDDVARDKKRKPQSSEEPCGLVSF